MTSPEILNAIRDMDPDGQDFGEAGPTQADYVMFEYEACLRYGRKAWDDYHKPAKEHGTYE